MIALQAPVAPLPAFQACHQSGARLLDPLVVLDAPTCAACLCLHGPANDDISFPDLHSTILRKYAGP